MVARTYVAVVLFILSLSLWVPQASGDHQGYVFPGLTQYNQYQAQMVATGEWRWAYEQECGVSLVSSVRGAFSDAQSRFGIQFVEGGGSNTRVQKNVATCGASFTGSCGAGFAVACVGYGAGGYPINCDAKYDAPVMATYYLEESRKGTVKHEWLHCSLTRAEGYCDRGAEVCPIICIYFPSVMGCGPSPDDFTNLDVEIWRDIVWPRQVDNTVIDLAYSPGNVTIWYGLSDSKATRIAVMGLNPDASVYYWAPGLVTPHGTPASLPIGINGLIIEGTWVTLAQGTCFYTNAENEASWRVWRTDRLAGCIP